MKIDIQKIKIQFRNATILMIGCLFVIIFSLFLYNYTLEYKFSGDVQRNLKEMTLQYKYAFDSEIKSKIMETKIIAKELGEYVDKIYEKETADILRDLKENGSFEDVIFVDSKGKGITSNGDSIDILSHECFQRSINGESLFLESVSNLYLETETIHLATPVYKNNVISGSIVCIFNSDNLSNIMVPIYSGIGSTLIVNGDGDIIVSTDENHKSTKDQTIYDYFLDSTFAEGKTIDNIYEDFKKEESGTIIYNYDGVDKVCYYMPLGSNKWFVLSIVPKDAVFLNIENTINLSIVLTIFVIAILILLILYILEVQRRTIRNSIKYFDNIEKVAFYDELTGFPNMLKFKNDAKALIENNNKKFSIMKLDISNFKAVNELFGFSVGDEIIKFMSESILEAREILNLDNDGCFARINNDEFLILDSADDEYVMLQRDKVFEKIFYNKSKDLLDRYKVSFKYGRYTIESDENDINKIIEKVNLAHYISKSKNLTSAYDFNKNIKNAYAKEAEITGLLHNAIESNEFTVYLQPKYNLIDKKIVGAEALVRWIKKDGTIAYPVEFIPIAEKSGIITEIDMYMLDKTCRIIRSWIENKERVVPISINFSRLHLQNKDFIDEVAEIVKKHNIPPELIELELTETAVSDGEERFRNLIDEIHDKSFSISIDDFGTGFSSLGLLKNLSVDTIKLDRSFVTDDNGTERAKTVVESVIDMSNKLSIKIVAEGVESQEEINFLQSIGCEVVQGYFFSKPIPYQDFKTE